MCIRDRGPTHRGGWRLHFSTDWICPRCTPRTGRRELLWQTALSPMCRHCHVLLVPATATAAPAREVVDAPRDLTGLVDELIDLAEASITHHSARVRLGRFRRLCALIAQTTVSYTHLDVYKRQTMKDVIEADQGAGHLVSAMWHYAWRGELVLDLDHWIGRTAPIAWAHGASDLSLIHI